MSDSRLPENSPKFLAQAKWRDGNPQKVWAQRALRSALKAGLITQMPCKVCGERAVEGHHSDYGRPLHVDWLCRLHHRQEHIRLKREED